MVEVEEDDRHRPNSIVSHGRRSRVTSVVDVWEVVDEWWRASSIGRRYYRIALEGEATVTVFHDLVSGSWYRQRV
jgi:hypothetical protein